MLELEDILGPDGPLQRALPDFRFRPQQLRMAKHVAAALERRSTLVVEAGTGTGKTFAYLVPALLSGLRVLISTGTRTLQDQLFAKDLPLVAGAIGRPVRTALLKGRANYLCRHRLALAQTQLALEESARGARARDGMLAKVERWARTTRTGDLAEVPGLADSHSVWPLVTSTRDNCLGARCPELSRCHVLAARREAQEADVVIVNHHLLLADLALKEDGFGDILGSADAVVLDEAHQIPDLAAQFFGASVSSRQIDLVLKESQLAAAAVNAGHEAPPEVRAAIGEVEESLAQLATALPARQGRLAWGDEAISIGIGAQLTDLADALRALAAQIEALGDDRMLAHAAERAGELALSLERLAASDELEGARAVEITQRGFTLSLTPFDVAPRFRALVDAHRCAWIFTSATLSLGEDFSHFTGRLGLHDAATLRIDSPFDYERQALLYLPTDLPDPSSPAHGPAVIDLAAQLIEAAAGGAFVLFTSHRALARGAQLLRERWGDNPPYRLFVQGEAPREQLLKAFREDGNGVLLGTASFWEGVDVKGEALRLVIIDKLPFASPDDPLVRARIEHLQSSGGNAFRDYQLPEAALALKQGVGRLIRSEEDFGAVVICDPRLTERSYGRVLLSALPPMRVTRDGAEARRFLIQHAPRATPVCETRTA